MKNWKFDVDALHDESYSDDPIKDWELAVKARRDCGFDRISIRMHGAVFVLFAPQETALRLVETVNANPGRPRTEMVVDMVNDDDVLSMRAVACQPAEHVASVPAMYGGMSEEA